MSRIILGRLAPRICSALAALAGAFLLASCSSNVEIAAHLRPGVAVTVGFRRPGLRMRPVGAPGTRKLQDILTDARVPRHLRDRLPLVFADGRLAWVPGIAVDVDAAAPLGTPALHVSLPGVRPESQTDL